MACHATHAWVDKIGGPIDTGPPGWLACRSADVWSSGDGLQLTS